MKTSAKVFLIIFGIFMIIGGISCMFSPISTSLALGYVVGMVMIFDAVGGFITWGQGRKAGAADGWMLTGAILSLIFGFFVLNSEALQLSIDVFIVYYIAVWFFLHGIVDIVRAFKILRMHKNMQTVVVGTHWYLPLLFGILLCVFGVLSMMKPVFLASTLGVFIGLGIISTGADMITLATTPKA